MVAPRREPMSVRITLYSLATVRICFMYDRDPGRLLVVLVICCCVNAMKANMKTICSVKEMGVKLTQVGGCKAKDKSTAVTL